MRILLLGIFFLCNQTKPTLLTLHDFDCLCQNSGRYKESRSWENRSLNLEMRRNGSYGAASG